MTGEELTVAEAAERLGTSPQTVRSLLRKGELSGRKRDWGSRYVWVVSREGLDEFLAAYGRLDGRRRGAPMVATPAPGSFDALFDEAPPPPKPFVLRPRGRATVVVVVLGVPLLVLYIAARLLPGALWFHELGQTDVFSRTVAAKLQLYLLVAAVAAVFVGVNLAVSLARTDLLRKRRGRLAVLGVSLVAGTLFASSAPQHWQTYLLWRHRQSFGLVDPIHGKDVGYFVFSLPLELLTSSMLMGLVAVSASAVAVVNLVRGTLGVRPLHATWATQCHLATLAAVFLVVVAWRLRLEQYRLELGQPAPGDRGAFAGAGYVDVHVRSPGLVLAALLVLVLAIACLVGPILARAGRPRRAVALVAVPGLVLATTAILAGAVVPALVQRLVVEPNPLLSEEPFVGHSIASTRAGLALDTIDETTYRPTGSFAAADFPGIRSRVATVAVWDAWVLEARMRQLVNDTPYYRPGPATLDVARVDGRRQPTVVSARQLDLASVEELAETWSNNRLAYTHGLGLVRFSGADIRAGREPRLLDSGLGLREPRIYFGDFPMAEPAIPSTHASAILAPTTDPRLADSPWALVDTRRPEVDIPPSDGAPRTSYHYAGPAGLELSGWVRRAAFALALGSPEVLLSDDITRESRLLLHRDVHERLAALAPFIQWDSDIVPLTLDGRIVFVVEGYTTSQYFPYGEHVALADSQVNYARASVRATVDAFSGESHLYLTDEADPIARAWTEAFPTLFRPEDELPSGLRSRLRYPLDLFAAQATAYERYHALQPDVFVSGADQWSRPLALSGPIEVAGDIDFDESDEDDLRFSLQPGYLFGRPPGEEGRRLLVRTLFSPRSGQNLVASLNGWIDQDGEARLAALNLPRDPVILGPAQMSRLAFATPRVRNLLGLRNLEIRDLARSSLDTVLLGRPRVLFLPGGPLQIQSLYEGSKGPGAARLIGVTVFLDGRTGLGPDIESAVRQALNEPPGIELLPVEETPVVGQPVELAYAVENAKRQQVIITSDAGRRVVRRDVTEGQGTVEWVPSVAGNVTVRLRVTGLDGTTVSDRMTFSVLGAPPRIRLIELPDRVEVGRSMRVRFQVLHGRTALVRVATRSGIVFTRRYLLRDRPALVSWTPRAAGKATLFISARGEQGQVTKTKLRLRVQPRVLEDPPPTVNLLRVPDRLRVGSRAEVVFRAEGCRTATAQIESPGDETRTWEFQCPTPRASFTWTPAVPGRHLLTVSARGSGTTTQVTTRLTVEDS